MATQWTSCLVLCLILLLIDSACAAAFSIPHQPTLLSRGSIVGSANSAMSHQVAHGLAIALCESLPLLPQLCCSFPSVVLAAAIGIVFYFGRCYAWYRRHQATRPPAQAPMVVLPPFLRDRRVAGTIPVVISPRTVAIVTANPGAYSIPPAVHSIPHYTANNGQATPLSPLPPAYSFAGAQRV